MIGLMAEGITILASASGNPIVKTFGGAKLNEQRFNIGTLFSATERPCSDLQSLCRLLQALESEATQTIIRGSLIDGQIGAVPRNRETFTATPRQWCMIDIDSLAWDGDIGDQKAMLSYAAKQLPTEFQSVDFWYQSASMVLARQTLLR